MSDETENDNAEPTRQLTPREQKRSDMLNKLNLALSEFVDECGTVDDIPKDAIILQTHLVKVRVTFNESVDNRVFMKHAMCELVGALTATLSGPHGLPPPELVAEAAHEGATALWKRAETIP